MLLTYTNTWSTSVKTDCCKRCPLTWWEAIGTNRNRELFLKLRNCFHSQGWLSTEHRIPRNITSEITKNHGSGQLVLGGSPWIERSASARGYLQSQPFCDFVIMLAVPHSVSLWSMRDGRYNQHSVDACETCLLKHVSWYTVISFILFCYCLLAPYSQTLCICLPFSVYEYSALT